MVRGGAKTGALSTNRNDDGRKTGSYDCMSYPGGATRAFALGFLALTSQVVLIRQLLRGFSGNELDIGLTLGAWLLFAGIGSIMGARLGFRTRRHLAIILFFSGAAVQAAVFGLRFWLGAGVPGEVASLTRMFGVTVIAVAPTALSAGSQFVCAVALMGPKDYAAGRVYLFEALGALSAGLLFTFVGSKIDAVFLVSALATAYILMGVLVAGRSAFRGVSLAFLPLLPVPLVVYIALGERAERAPWPHGDLRILEESPRGEVALVKEHGQFNLYGSGGYRFSYPDPEVEERTVHVPISLHKAPRRLFLIGGSPGTAREALKYKDLHVDYAVEDPVAWNALRSVLTAEDTRILASPRFRPVAGDPRSYLRDRAGLYDLIVLAQGPPGSSAANRLYTVEFFRTARRALRPDGLVVLRGAPSFGYAGGPHRELNRSIYQSLKAVFPFVALSAPETALFAAGETLISPEPAELARRFQGRAVETRSFNALLFQGIFDPLETADVRRTLAKTGTLNTDEHPAVYRLYLAYWADLQKSAVLRLLVELPGLWWFCIAGIAGIAIIAAGRGSRQRALYGSMGSTGFFGMAVSVAVILGYQSAEGLIYEQIGLISALFMAGAALGAAVPSRVGAGGGERGVLVTDLSSAGLAFMTPLVLGPVWVFYAVAATAGLITGAQFGYAARSDMSTSRASDWAGRLYGLDLAGGTIGAFLPAVFLIPLLGVKTTLYLTGGIKAASALGLALSLRLHKSGLTPVETARL